MDDNAPVLPGLNTAGQASNTMLRAATEYVATLRADGLLSGHHVLTVQLVLGLAEAIGKAAAKGQAAAMAMASKELREAMAMLPAPAASGDAFTKFLQELNNDPTTEDAR